MPAEPVQPESSFKWQIKLNSLKRFFLEVWISLNGLNTEKLLQIAFCALVLVQVFLSRCGAQAEIGLFAVSCVY